jgi:hypothetical protein
MGRIGIERQGAVDDASGCGMFASENRESPSRHPEGIGVFLTGLDGSSRQTYSLRDFRIRNEPQSVRPLVDPAGTDHRGRGRVGRIDRQCPFK